MAGAADFVAPRPLAVTVGNYLLMYADGRFARHPHFRYFALNTEMRWRALQAGRICVCQHSHDAQLFCVNIVVGASLSEPHINGTSAARVCYISIIII